MKSGRLQRVIGFLLAVILLGSGVAFGEEKPAEELDALHPVDTVDVGVFRLVDFDGNEAQNAFLKDRSSTHGQASLQGLLSDFLGEDGYPMNRDGVSMAELYAGGIEARGLFPAEVYRESGALEFDSTQNFASLREDGSFTVYRELGTVDSNHATLDKGLFLPFNDLVPGYFSTKHPLNLRNILNEELADDDPRKGERLYAISGDEVDYYFGMEMTVPFVFPENGLDAQGREIIAEFTGDDDLWLYVDGVLTLDLGGIHSAIPGRVNFSTGEVTCRGSDGKDYTTTLYSVFRRAWEAEHQGASEQEVLEYLSGRFTESGFFPGGSGHTMRLFYMERGAGSSNLSMRFVLPAEKDVLPDTGPGETEQNGKAVIKEAGEEPAAEEADIAPVAEEQSTAYEEPEQSIEPAETKQGEVAEEPEKNAELEDTKQGEEPEEPEQRAEPAETRQRVFELWLILREAEPPLTMNMDVAG